MSAGMSLIKVLCRQGARELFRQLVSTHFIAEEIPCYNFVATYYRQHGQLPTFEALNDNGFPMIGWRDNEAASYYLQRMASRFVVLATRDVMQELNQALQANDGESARVIVSNLAQHIRGSTTGSPVISLADSIDDVIEAYEFARLNPGIQGRTMGYAWLDNITGGMQNGDVITLAARTGMGKSYFLNHICMASWLSGASVLLVSNEMTALQTTTRFIGQYAGISPERIRRGELDHWDRDIFYTQTEAMKTGAPFTLVDGSFNVDAEDLDTFVQEFNPDLVAIDASYLMKTRQANKNQQGHEQARELSKDLKRLALNRNKPVIQTVQLSAQAQKKTREELDTGMIGGTIGTSQDSTTVLILSDGPSPWEDIQRDILVKKNREGRKSWMRTHFLFDPMNFDFITSKEEEAATGGPAPVTGFAP